MPNLVLTNRCNRNCVYCFAAENITKDQFNEISFDNFKYVINFLERSNYKKINLLGGEPTLHSRFAFFLGYVLARGFDTAVFSNGMASPETVARCEEVLQTSKYRHIRFCVNINEKQYRSDHEISLQHNFFQTLNSYISLSFNIYKPDWEYRFLVDTIREYGLKKQIRLGLASPINGYDKAKNAYARPEHYRQIYSTICQLSDYAAIHGVTVNFDCGFPLCGFTDEELGRLYKNGVKFQFFCDTPIDIGTDLTTWNCFPLSAFHNKNLNEFKNLREVKEYYFQIFGDYRKNGLYRECDECDYKIRKTCSGGCLGHHYLKSNLSKMFSPQLS